MPAIKLSATYAVFALAASLAAQSNLLVEGLEAYNKGDYVTAERSFRKAVAQGGGDARAASLLALVQASTGRCADAEPLLAKAAGSNAGNDAALGRLAALALARCRLAAGRLDEAAGILDRLRAKDPADADVLYETARLQMRAWNETIRQLYEKAPSSFRVNQLSAEILETQGQYAEAAEEYRKAIAKNPRALNLHFQLARALLNSSHAAETLDRALQEIEAELAMNPSDAVATYQAARILQVRQHPAEADARYEQALKLRPDFVEALCALGTLRNEERRSAEAIPLLEKAVQLAPASEAGHYALMIAYRNSGRMDDARREKARLDELHKTPEGEFSDFLKKLGEKPPAGK
ncbi:MAG: tetratricopeptide repeat protein [Bryobacteraceae bacterium]|jgi:tetratricopeptide (TPR) repeat protein